MFFESFLKKYKGLILYLVFGVLTTLVNYVTYIAFYNSGILSNVAATIVSWVAATVFAFITNKIFVFESSKSSPKEILSELGSFYFFRIATGVLDLGIMWILVDVMSFDGGLCKLLSNVLVIILNYLASKMFIFKK